MIALVTGGASSGKSGFAEELCGVLSKRDGCRKLYLATMKNDGKEAAERIRRHRSLRAGKGFETIEAENTAQIGALQTASGDLILLETLSVLAANEMFSECGVLAGAQDETSEEIARRIFDSLKTLVCRHLILVSDEIFSDGLEWEGQSYDPMTLRYLEVLGILHRLAAGEAELVAEVAAGGILFRKGKELVDIDQYSDSSPVPGLHLVISGAYQGGEEYGKRMYPEAVQLSDLYERFREALKEGRNPEQELDEEIEGALRQGELAVWALEIGSGVVPIDPFTRSLRERYGRYLCRLAGRAFSVERLYCGLSERIR